MTAVPFTPSGFDPKLFGLLACSLAVAVIAGCILDRWIRPDRPTR
jgi:hypothetical protein